MRFRFNKHDWENFKKSKNARFHFDWKGFKEKIKSHVHWRNFKPNFKLKFNIDWKNLRDNKKLKFNIGLAVILIVFFVIFPDTMFLLYRSSHNLENKPAVSPSLPKKPAIKQAIPAVRPAEAGKQAGKNERAVKEKSRLSRKLTGKVAIVLDDAGGKAPDYDSIRSIKEPLTISVIPNMPDSENVAKAMSDAGFEVMLHLPMEARSANFRKTGGGMVSCSESDDEIRKTVLDDLVSVKWAVGVNNHMGSKATADERVMKVVLSVLKGRELFFIDSRTSDRSIAYKLAKSFQIPSAENNIFLDSQTDRTYIEANFRRLISMAGKNGSSIGIGHATRPMTVSVLKRLMPEYENDGIDFVFASELVK